MIKVICFRCKTELVELGAILLSPPFNHNPDCVMKHHICKNCFYKIFKHKGEKKSKGNENKMWIKFVECEADYTSTPKYG